MNINRCKKCDTVDKNRKWHSKTMCASCYQKNYITTNALKRKCVTCGSDNTTGSWYRGPKCGKCYHKYRYINNRGKTIGQKYCHMISQSKRRNSICDIDKESYIKIVNQGCFYCGRDLMEVTGHSLDKIKPDLGYVIDNVLPCCGDCNSLRMNILTVEETKKLVVLLKELRETKESPWLIEKE